MTEEEYFRKTYPDSCYGDKPLSPYWDYFQDGVEFGERQSEKKIEVLEKEVEQLREKNLYMFDTIALKSQHIEKLEKENEKLKAKNKWYSEQVCNKECAEVWGQLTKAKEIIRDYMIIVKGGHITVCSVPEESRCINVLKLNEQAEQFLKDLEKVK